VLFAKHQAISAALLLTLITLLFAAARDALRTRVALLADNALLRHQLIVLERSVPRPRFRRIDRVVAVALAAITPAWREALLIVQPATLLRWHRAGFRALWRWRSRGRSPRVPRDTVALIRSMAADNRLWGAERIRGELLKLGIRVSKRTVYKYMRRARASRAVVGQLLDRPQRVPRRHPRLRRHQHQHRRLLLVFASHRASKRRFHPADVDPLPAAFLAPASLATWRGAIYAM
jgi:hypothetical protein